MIQGVIFDMDGLMFDTERIWATLWEPALAGLGLSYKEGLDEAARGTAGDSMRAVLRRFYGPDCDPDRIIEALHEQGVIAFQAPPPKKPGLDEILAWLEQRHIPMVVASSSRMASIRHHLDSWGLTWGVHSNNHFDITLAAFAQVGAAAVGEPAPLDTHWIWQDGQDLLLDAPKIVNGKLQVPDAPGLGVHLNMERVMQANALYNSLPSHDRDDAMAMQYLIPNWKYDHKKPCLVR